MQKAMRRIEEARNDDWNIHGPRLLGFSEWAAQLMNCVGLVANDIIRYESKTALDGKDVLASLTYELAHTGALCVAMMEAVDAEYAKLDGPRIREFQQVAIGE